MLAIEMELKPDDADAEDCCCCWGAFPLVESAVDGAAVGSRILKRIYNYKAMFSTNKTTPA